MTIESLTYAELGRRLGISSEAARKKARALGLPTALGNDGRKRISVDLSEIRHSPRAPRRTAGGRPSSGGLVVAGEVVRLVDDVRAVSARTFDANAVRALQDRIVDLEAEIAARPSPQIVAQLEARITDLQADRNEWREQAQALAAHRRSWWQRLIG